MLLKRFELNKQRRRRLKWRYWNRKIGRSSFRNRPLHHQQLTGLQLRWCPCLHSHREPSDLYGISSTSCHLLNKCTAFSKVEANKQIMGQMNIELDSRSIKINVYFIRGGEITIVTGRYEKSQHRMIPDWFNERFSIATDGNVKALFPKRVKGESLRNSLCNQDKKKQVNQSYHLVCKFISIYVRAIAINKQMNKPLVIDIWGSTPNGCLTLSAQETLRNVWSWWRYRLMRSHAGSQSLIHSLSLELHSLRFQTKKNPLHFSVRDCR